MAHLCRQFRPVLHQRKFLPVVQLQGRLPPFRPSSSPAFSRLLDESQRAVVDEERSLLFGLHEQLLEMGTPLEELQILRDAITQMDELFMVCVVGEFNAGKSTFINALLGDTWCQEGVLPTTATVCVLKYGEEVSRRNQIDAFGESHEDVEELRLPVPWLEELVIVDTPGTNAIVASHEQLTRRIVPRADLVLFVTSADRPFSESERTFLTLIAKWGKKVVFVVNKIDILPTSEDGSNAEAVDTIVNFVSQNSSSLMEHGVTPTVLPVSSKLALRAKLASPSMTSSTSSLSNNQEDDNKKKNQMVERRAPELGAGAKRWEESRFADLESYMRKSLTEDERVLGKLLTPCKVAEQLMVEAEKRCSERQCTLESDLATVTLVQENMTSFQKDLFRDVAFERFQVGRALRAMSDRADDFLDSNMTLTNASQVFFEPAAFQRSFSDEVVRGVDEAVEESLQEMSTLIEERARNQARAVLDFLGRRPANNNNSASTSSMVGALHDSHFDGVRFRVLKKLQEELAEVTGKGGAFHREEQAEEIRSAVHTTLMAVAALEVGALTAAATTAAATLTAAVDVTGGVVTASALAVGGAAVLPLRRAQQKRAIAKQVSQVCSKVDASLETRLERELHRVSERILESVAPYARFVTLEHEKAEKQAAEVTRLKEKVKALKQRILK